MSKLNDNTMAEFVGQIIDGMEDYLEGTFGITPDMLPNPDRDEDSNDAIICGQDYDDIRDAIEAAVHWHDKGYFDAPTANSPGYYHRVQAIEEIYEVFDGVRQSIDYNWHSPSHGWDNTDEAAIKLYVIDCMYKWEVFV